MRSRLGQAVDRIRKLARGHPAPDFDDRKEEQLGQTRATRPDGKVVWLLTETAAEAGPGPALAQAIEAHIEAEVHVLVTPIETSPLVYSVEKAIVHQFAPGDTEGSVVRFLEHWHPEIGVVVGEPNRPNLLAAAKESGVYLYHVAGHRDGLTKARRPPTYLHLFETCFAASASDANYLRVALKQKATNIEITGPLSDTIYALPCNNAECDDLAKLLGGRPVWLAAEVGGLEIGIVEAAHRKAFKSAHRLLLIIVPKIGEDPEAIAQQLEEAGWRVARRSNLEEPDPEIQVYIADTDDELGLWYRLAPASFIGGTLRSGVEPSEPFHAAALGSAVLTGPNHGQNPSRFRQLEAHGASIPVANAEELGEAVVTLLAPDKAASLAQAGWTATTESAHVVERLAEVIGERLTETEGAN